MKPTRDNIIELSLAFSGAASELLIQAAGEGDTIGTADLLASAYRFSTAAHDLLTAALRFDGW